MTSAEDLFEETQTLVTNPQGEPGLRDEVIQTETPQGMAELLEGESQEFRSPRRGDIIDGVIMGIDRDAILVDIGSKTEGVVPTHEMRSLGPDGLSQLNIGDEILIYVVQPENQEGQVVLSLDRASGERGWRSLQQRFEAEEYFEAEVVGYNKGGLLVNIEGVRGFVPTSQVVGLRYESSETEASETSLEERFAQWIGKSLRLKIIEINRRRNRLILSERAAVQAWRVEQKDRLLQELQEGVIRHGKVTSIRPFGVFIDLGGAEGLVHLSELSWGRIRGPEDVVQVGDEVDVYVLKVDHENKKIGLSLRRAHPEEWDAVVGKYTEGQLVRGTITKLATFGAFAHIEGPVEGLIHISELADRRIQHPKEVVKEGDVITLKIIRIETDRRRLALSLRQSIEELESQEHGALRQQLENLSTQSSTSGSALGDVVTPSTMAALELMGQEAQLDGSSAAENEAHEETDTTDEPPSPEKDG